MEDDLKKMEDDLKRNDGRLPKKKMEDDLGKEWKTTSSTILKISLNWL